MRRQKQNEISCWVLGLIILLLSYVPSVPAEMELTPSDQTVARFLYQSTFGPTPTLIDEVEEVGMESWISQQIYLPATYHQPLYRTPFSKAHNPIAKTLGIKLLLLLMINSDNAWRMH